MEEISVKQRLILGILILGHPTCFSERTEHPDLRPSAPLNESQVTPLKIAALKIINPCWKFGPKPFSYYRQSRVVKGQCVAIVNRMESRAEQSH